jgi:hypothetical protein
MGAEREELVKRILNRSFSNFVNPLLAQGHARLAPR